MEIKWIDHDAYTEAYVSGDLADADIVSMEDVPQTVNQRLFVNFNDVRQYNVSLSRRIGIAERRLTRNDRVAVWSGDPVVFGLCRQAALMARVRLGGNYGVFLDRDEAVRWLTEPLPAPK